MVAAYDVPALAKFGQCKGLRGQGKGGREAEWGKERREVPWAVQPGERGGIRI